MCHAENIAGFYRQGQRRRGDGYQNYLNESAFHKTFLAET